MPPRLREKALSLDFGFVSLAHALKDKNEILNENLITIMRDEWGHVAPGDKALDDFMTQQRIAVEQLTAAILSGIESESGGPSTRAKKAAATSKKTETPENTRMWLMMMLLT